MVATFSQKILIIFWVITPLVYSYFRLDGQKWNLKLDTIIVAVLYWAMVLLLMMGKFPGR